MLYSVLARRAGWLYISGVDIIVYSWFKGLAGTSMWRISVNNVRAFNFVPIRPYCPYGP